MSQRLLARLAYEAALLQPRAQEPGRLLRHGAKVFSQNDEDGIIAEILARIGEGDRRFLEIGVEDGRECNTAALLLAGWTGAWIEADVDKVAAARARYAAELASGALTIIEARVEPETIARTLSEAGVGEVDLLSVDIDGDDFWLWAALDGLRPRVAVIEYNAGWAPPLDVTVRPQPGRGWDGTTNHGASLVALERLGRRKGYALVGCSFAGVNAFFVRQDLVGDRFAAPFTAANHYEPPRYELGPVLAGHPPGWGPHVRAPVETLSRPAPDGRCRLCGGAGVFLFERTVLGVRPAAYFQCTACGSVYTEPPDWLADAYAFPGVHIDVGMAGRAVRNWLLMSAVLPALGFGPEARLVDYGGGSGLFTRLMRDSGFDALTNDAFRSSYFADYWQADDLAAAAPQVVTAFEVLEHFADPARELHALLAAQPDILIFTTEFCDGVELASWDYLVPECGQHVFFYSERGLRAFAAVRGYLLIVGAQWKALVRSHGVLGERWADVQVQADALPSPEHRLAQADLAIAVGPGVWRDAGTASERFKAQMAARAG